MVCVKLEYDKLVLISWLGTRGYTLTSSLGLGGFGCTQLELLLDLIQNFCYAFYD
jgi:hypothetical protein